jgi:hypothetical protein
MPIALIPVIIKIIFMILEFLAQKKIVSEESKRIFINMAEELRKLGIANVKSRYEAEAQLDANDKAWANIEEGIKDRKTPLQNENPR